MKWTAGSVISKGLFAVYKTPWKAQGGRTYRIKVRIHLSGIWEQLLIVGRRALNPQGRRGTGALSMGWPQIRTSKTINIIWLLVSISQVSFFFFFFPRKCISSNLSDILNWSWETGRQQNSMTWRASGSKVLEAQRSRRLQFFRLSYSRPVVFNLVCTLEFPGDLYETTDDCILSQEPLNNNPETRWKLSMRL